MKKVRIFTIVVMIFFSLLLNKICVSQQFNNLILQETPEFIIRNDYDIKMIKKLMSVNFDSRYRNDDLYNRVKNNYFIAEYYLGKIQAKIDILYQLAKINEQEEAKLKQAISYANQQDMDIPINRNSNQELQLQGYKSSQYLLTQLYKMYKRVLNELLTKYIDPKGNAIVYYTSLYGHVNEVKFIAEATNNFNVGYTEAGGMTQRQFKIKRLGLFFNKFFFSNGNTQAPTVPAGAAISFLHILSETYK